MMRGNDSSLAYLWPAVSPFLDTALVPQGHHQWLHRVFNNIPYALPHFLGFEVRLGAWDGATDCAISLTPDGARLLASYAADASQMRANPAWNRLRTFLTLWANSRQWSFADATRIWLEFDMGDENLAPNVLFGYRPRTHEAWRTRSWLLDAAIPALLGAPLPASVRGNINRVLDACPTSDDLQIGVMCARPVPVIRLCLFDLPDTDLPTYLSDVRWNGDATRLAAFVRDFRPHADFVGLHFDVGEMVYPHAGVEPGFSASSWSRQPHREPRWTGQFDVLSKAHLITLQQRAAMLAWPGYQRLRISGQDTAVLRGLSHLKVVLRSGGTADAKGYFGVAERATEVAHGN